MAYRDVGGRFISATVWEAAWLLAYGEVPDDGGEVAPLTAAEVAELAEEFGVPHEYSEDEEAILDDLRDFDAEEWCEAGTEFELTAKYAGGD